MPTDSTTPQFTPALLGQTEKALNAILDRLLDGTDVTEPQWVTLTLAVSAGPEVERDALVGRAAHGLRVDQSQAAERVEELIAAGLLAPAAGEKVRPSDEGLALFTRVRTEVAGITERMWGDQSAEDLATVARILTTVHARADAELHSA